MTLAGGYLSAEIQLAYSTASADWAGISRFDKMIQKSTKSSRIRFNQKNAENIICNFFFWEKLSFWSNDTNEYNWLDRDEHPSI